MKEISVDSVNVTLSIPDPERDAPFALNWFQSDYGRETLLLMGNAESEIKESTLESEKNILQEFLDLEKSGDQFTWMIRHEGRTIGAVWVELKDNDEVKSPSIHIMLGDKQSRGKGIGRAVLAAVIKQVSRNLPGKFIYSRYLFSNGAIARVLQSLGFANDGKPYKDVNGLIWQNVVVGVSG